MSVCLAGLSVQPGWHIQHQLHSWRCGETPTARYQVPVATSPTPSFHVKYKMRHLSRLPLLEGQPCVMARLGYIIAHILCASINKVPDVSRVSDDCCRAPCWPCMLTCLADPPRGSRANSSLPVQGHIILTKLLENSHLDIGDRWANHATWWA